MKQSQWGTYHDQSVMRYTLTDGRVRITISNYGATLVDFAWLTSAGEWCSIILHSDNLQDYLNTADYIGATVGRVAGRIAQGTFSLNGQEYHIPLNEPAAANHGGPQSFNTRIWTVREVASDHITLTLLSPAGDNGFPGAVEASVTYALHDGDMVMTYQATTDAPTLFNPTNHAYFNLTGQFDRPLGAQQLQIDSDVVAALGTDHLPTGELLPVKGTTLDFRNLHALTEVMAEYNDQTRLVAGIDHAYLLNQPSTADRPQTRLCDPESGLVLTLTTSADAIVVYTANMFDENRQFGSFPMVPHSALTLEAQQLPDAIHHENFGSITLTPDQPYRQETRYHLSQL